MVGFGGILQGCRYRRRRRRARATEITDRLLRPRLRGSLLYFFGGYFSNDFFTISSSLPSILRASLLSSVAMARPTSDRVLGSRRSITSVPSLSGTRTTRVRKPYHPAGYVSSCALRAAPK